ncbi:MAG: phenylalanine--tRNA ligase subunit alpha [Actinobacteria bacterium HGW-Actinobacteria-7]|nr:MAG: phenylalanine--tRNA ligase subunit alpha [Actinobacteria bacterium HGW-Actinobacteria-7]
MSVVEQLKEQQSQGLAAIMAASDLTELDGVRVAYLGKKGSLTGVLRGLGTLSPEERPAVGKTANEVREALESALEARKSELSAADMQARISADVVDVTLPGRKHPLGTRHLINRIAAEITDIFVGLGYQIAEGPEVELEYYNFTALNHPPQHPARAATDTFYVRDLSGDQFDGPEPSGVLLRTHTSPVQVRTLENAEPPVYVLAPGKVYRRDIADPSHLPQFTQIEGLVVDEGITFADLKGTLDHLVREIFGPDRRTRFRPHFFPFTEPSAEVDVSCGICNGEGCRFCKNSGWLEILGCGMVDPNVFGHVGIDPERYTGFAFGLGVERIAALKYNVPDLRMLVEGDMRFLRQF